LHRFDTIQESDRQTDGQTDGQTPRPWLRRAKHSAIARKKPVTYMQKFEKDHPDEGRQM